MEAKGGIRFSARYGFRENEQQRLLYDDMRYNRIADRLRLEQERIGFEYEKKDLKMNRNSESKPVQT